MITYRGQKFAGYNKPKATPGAPKKSAVLAKEDGKVFPVPKITSGKPENIVAQRSNAQRDFFGVILST